MANPIMDFFSNVRGMWLADATGAQIGTATAPLMVQGIGSASTAGTDRSGTVTTTSGGFSIAALATRKPGDVQGQNVGANPIYFNEFGGTAVAGAAGTYGPVAAGGTFSITTNRLVNFISTGGTSAVTITDINV